MNKMPHIQLDDSIGATAAILPGDPARVDAIAEFLTDRKEEGFNREYKSITGFYKGRRILAISTGMGGASTAICVEELADLGFRDLIRIGSCGALQTHLRLGELVLCDRAVCDDGTSQTYTGYLRYAAAELNLSSSDAYSATYSTEKNRLNPQNTQEPLSSVSAFCHPQDTIQFSYADSKLLTICETQAKKLQLPYVIGPTRCHDALYQRNKPSLDEFYSAKGIYASDMETAALFAVGALRGLRTASILNVVVEWKQNLKDGISSYKDGADAAALGERNEILLALETLAASV